jgi:hypothetical protein
MSSLPVGLPVASLSLACSSRSAGQGAPKSPTTVYVMRLRS